MASRHGYEYGKELVEKHGWVWADISDFPEDWVGDLPVVDPVTGERMNPYAAKELQEKRDKVIADEAKPEGTP